jgi:hypothetical protein
MLDLTKLARQIQGLSQHLTLETVASQKRLELAEKYLKDACTRQDELVTTQDQWRDRVLFANATPLEPLNTCIDIPVPPKVHTVIATDGSQIAPNHHEIAYCYLLNIGRVVLHYGQNKQPLLDSLPEVFYRAEDLYESRKWGIGTEEWMGYRRTASEAVVLAELSCAVARGENVKQKIQKNSELSTENLPLFAESLPTRVPTLAMVDGSLVYWFLEQIPLEARETILPPILAAWEEMQAAKVPLMGYLSASRNVEATNFCCLSSSSS